MHSRRRKNPGPKITKKQIRRRKIKPQRTAYDITVKPTTTVLLNGPTGISPQVNKKTISIRGRKKPRKARIALIKWFNNLVEKKVVFNLKFDKKGYFEHADFSRELTDKELKLLRKVIFITKEPTLRGEVKSGKIVKTKVTARIDRMESAMKEHERRGQFVFIDPTVELTIMEEHDTEFLFTMAERIYRRSYADERKKIAGYDKNKVQANLRKQLRYFQSVLKAKKRKQMVIGAETMEEQEEVTIIKLDGDKVVRETTTNSPSRNYIDFDVHLAASLARNRVILWPNGKITFETADYEQPERLRNRFRKEPKSPKNRF